MNPTVPPAASTRRPPRLALIAGAILAAVVLLYWLRPGTKGVAETGYHTVRRGDFTVSIVEAGNLAAVNEVVIRNEVEGTARIIYIVPEGTYARKGDLLVELDSAQAQDQVNQQQINFEKAQFAHIQATEQLGIQQSAADSDIRAAQLKVNFARLDLDKFERGERVVLQVEASNKLVQAEARLALNLDTYTWTTNLAAKGYETKAKADSDRLAVLTTRNELIVASNSIWMLNEFDLRKQRETFESALREAEKELERVEAQSRAKLAQATADLLTQSNTLVLNSRKLERDRKNLEATRRTAPQDGLVVYAVGENRFSSESLIEEGATVRNRQEIIKLPDTSRMKVTVKVHESHVNLVRAGLPAFVILDSMPDTRFRGHVDRVALLPDTQSRFGNPNLKVYNTEVHILDALPDVKPGVSAKAEIIITNIANALSVPIQSVTTLRGRQVVYVLRGSQPEPRPVEVGPYNTKFIQIVSGVEEGDRVLLAPPFDTHEKDLEGTVLEAEERARLATNPPPAAIPTAPRPTPPGGAPPETTSVRPPRERPPSASPAPGMGAPTPTAAGAPAAALAAADGPGGPGAPGGPGGPGRPGGGNGPRFNPEEMMKRFDTDGDGQLSEEERAAMRQSFGNRGNRGNRGNGGEGGRGGNGSGEPGGERPPRPAPEPGAP